MERARLPGEQGGAGEGDLGAPASLAQLPLPEAPLDLPLPTSTARLATRQGTLSDDDPSEGSLANSALWAPRLSVLLRRCYFQKPLFFSFFLPIRR